MYGVQSCWIELLLNISGRRNRRRTGEPPCLGNHNKMPGGRPGRVAEAKGEEETGRASSSLASQRGDSENVGHDCPPGPIQHVPRQGSRAFIISH